MINGNGAYYDAITADSRRIHLRAVISIIDPDLVYGDITSSGESEYSNNQQLIDKVFDNPTKYVTLEHNRWMLDGSWTLYPDDLDGLNIKYLGSVLSDVDGTFDPPQWVALAFSDVSILQACSIYFPDDGYDGVPDTLTIDIMQGGTVYYSKTLTGNREAQINLSGFVVNDPGTIRITVSKWSLPYRRVRMVEIVPGIYETWTEDILSAFGIVQQASFNNLSLPYGTCNLAMDNQDRRFEPRNKTGIFQSIETRQGIETSIGVEMPDGTIQWRPTGVYYQYANGWKTGNNDISMQWSLVDIIGLLSDMQYIPPSTLPTTAQGWIVSIVSQLGVNFAERYIIDSNLADTTVIANSAEDVSGKSCGEILRMVCMAIGGFARADNETGYLAVEPTWSEGAKMTLDNMSAYPTMQANDDIAAIIFTLADDNNTEYVVSGTSTASGNTVQVQNPFIHTQTQALAAAKQILATYGGNQILTTGRGNPSSEIGDVDTVWLDDGNVSTGRRMSQTFAFSGGVMQGCQSTLLQADGSYLFEERAIITTNGPWTAPAGASQLRIILVGGGSNGADGTDGTFEADGEAGANGAGGYVWAGTISINPQQQFEVSVGQGGNTGTATTFGAYSSANGQRYDNGYTDIASGNTYARTGVANPQPNTGDGGAGGAGGLQGNTRTQDGITYVETMPTAGQQGTAGVSGCVIVYWDKEAA